VTEITELQRLPGNQPKLESGSEGLRRVVLVVMNLLFQKWLVSSLKQPRNGLQKF